MVDLQKRDKIRIDILFEVYEQVNGARNWPVDLKDVGRKLGIEPTEVNNAYYYLTDEGYLEYHGAGLTVCMTHLGIKQVESLVRKVDFDSDSSFSRVELYQLKESLDEIKLLIQYQGLGQELLFEKIEETFNESKKTTKKNWKDFTKEQLKSWVAQNLISTSASELFEAKLFGN